MHDPRSHLYRSIHKAVRSLLGQLSSLAGATDFSRPSELERLRERVQHDFGMLASHAHHEDAHVMPLLALYAPEIARRLDAAHEDQHDTMPRLEAALAAIDPTGSDAAERGAEFCMALSRYMADQLDHMADEEMLAMPALYAALDDTTLIEVHDKLVASVPPEEMMRWLSYMLPALNGSERTGMLLGMGANAPREAFEAVIQLARQVLAPKVFDDLSQQLASVLGRAA
ncbi:MAG: hemerythrin domain-containing protein [Myxococcales bacterium]